jgi:hypothetical protein
MMAVLAIAQRPKRCSDPHCPGHGAAWKSAEWQHIAPWYGTYGYDVIAQIGWQRQTHGERFADIQASLRARVQISESGVRRLYHAVYLPLLACHERHHLDRLEAVARQVGLMLALDGLAPEGGEPQLWVVRELQTGLTLRSGWLSRQDEPTFVHFLQPIRDRGWRVLAVLSDKQQGLVPAVSAVFPEAKHAFCQLHYLKNAAAPLAEADEVMKVALRKDVRAQVGELIRSEDAEESPGVLTVTGLVPSPVSEPTPSPVEPPPPDASGADAEPAPAPPTAEAPEAAEREAIVQAVLRRVRYVLTFKARPPLRLAGLEMFEALTAVVHSLDKLIQHYPEVRLVQLRHGLSQALERVRPEYTDLRQAADWVQQIADLLDPDDQPPRSGDEVRRELWAYLDRIHAESGEAPRLGVFCAAIRKVSLSYDAGLFHTYDLVGLPRTNNGCESEFRDVTRRLLSTTGQKGLTRRLLQRAGAWELIPHPATLSETVTALSGVDTQELRQEQQRVRTHRNRFRLHTRSAKGSRTQLGHLEHRWIAIPAPSGP